MIAKRANADRKCYRCGSTIPAGSVYYGQKERATCYREMMHAGTWYPERKICAACKAKSDADRAAATQAAG